MMNPLQSPLPNAKHEYRDINHFDHAHAHAHELEDGSSTDYDYEDDDKLAWNDDVLRDASHLGRRRSRAKRVRGVISSCRALLDTVLLVVILWLLVDKRKVKKGQVGGDVTGFAPEFSQQITRFSPDPSFIPTNVSAFFDKAVQDRWLEIVPRGLGYVTINDTTSYDNLPVPLVFYPDNSFTTSMTHQLHCLHSIIGVVAAFSSGRTDKLPPEGPWHIAHCFDYLRQSIMCAGDVALEGQQTTFPAGFKGSDGWDAKHVCKSYGEIMGYLEGNRADDEKWI